MSRIFYNAISFIQNYSNADLLLVKSDKEYDDELYSEKLVDLTVTDKNSNCTNIILVDEETEAETILKRYYKYCYKS